jgi:hypothetical protein
MQPIFISRQEIEEQFRILAARSLNEGVTEVVSLHGKDDQFIQSIVENYKAKRVLQECLAQLRECRTIQEKFDILRMAQEGLRSRMILEAKGDAADVFQSTGINILVQVLPKILPTIEMGYKSLTSSQEQRTSYRAHIVTAIQNALDQLSLNLSSNQDGTPDVQPQASEPVATAQSPAPTPPAAESSPQAVVEAWLGAALFEQEDVATSPDATAATQPWDTTPDEQGMFLGGSPEGEQAEQPLPPDDGLTDKEREEMASFAIAGQDPTGRNMAFDTFKNIKNQILKKYSLLGNDEDRELFKTYLIANVKLYFDRYENELSNTLPEPTNATYETGKTQTGQDVPPVGGQV